jgi:hypothetical protein
MYNPWNFWFAYWSQPARVWLGTLRGVAEGLAKDNAETVRRATDNVIDAEARFSESASKPKRRVAAAAVRNTHRRSGRAERRGKKVRKRRAA